MHDDWPPDDLIERFDEIVRTLDVMYGPRVLEPTGDPVGQLVGTILSQSTNDRNSRAAYRSLRETFPIWQDVIDASVEDVQTSIAYGGLSRQKAPRIQSALRSLLQGANEDHPDLASLPVDEAMDWLVHLDGVGPKTAACVLLFALGRPIMPVDTHVGRVMTRLGIVPDHSGTVLKQSILTTLIGNDAQAIYAVHVETIAHGRAVCVARRPRCEECELRSLCDYYAREYGT